MEGIEERLSDTIIERPITIALDECYFSLCPPSLGKMQLLGRMLKALDVDSEIMEANAAIECLRLVETKRKDVCRYIAYCTCKTKEELFNEQLIKKRTNFLDRRAEAEDLSSIFLLLLSRDNVKELIKYLGIDKEKERLQQVQRAKESKNSFTFGGVSIYGQLIDQACERYGWTYDYVLWGISYANLQLLLADSVKSIYLTDAERKKVHLAPDRRKQDVINADDPANIERIKAMKWN